jgi:hypothetical protein
MHGPGDTCDCKARLAQITTHTRTSTPQGPDFCEECSDAVSEWVQWPCPASASASEPLEALVEVLTRGRCVCGHDFGRHHIDTGCHDSIGNAYRCPCPLDMPNAEATALVPFVAAREAKARAEAGEPLIVLDGLLRKWETYPAYRRGSAAAEIRRGLGEHLDRIAREVTP